MKSQVKETKPLPLPEPTETDSFREIGPGDSRHPQKMRDIRATVDRMVGTQSKHKEDWERKFGEELEEATLAAVLKGGVNCVGYRRSYARNFESWIRSIRP
jgi:hypothetical protein